MYRKEHFLHHMANLLSSPLHKKLSAGKTIVRITNNAKPQIWKQKIVFILFDFTNGDILTQAYHQQ